MEQNFSIDALIPAEMAKKAELAGVAKANLGVFRMFALAVLAGAFIGMGAVFATTATTGASSASSPATASARRIRARTASPARPTATTARAAATGPARGRSRAV